MKRNKLRIIIGSIILTLFLQTTAAQPVARIGYFMDNATHKHLLNPALVPVRGYFSYPGLGSVDFDTRSNLGYTNFIFPGLNEGDPLLTFMHEDVTPEQFLSLLSPDNYFKLNQRLSLLSFGFYAGTSFWTFEVASRINTKLNTPYDFFAFLKNGMTGEAGNTYEIRDLSLSAGMLAETSLGSSFRITDKIRVGVKGKLLVGGAKAVGGIDEMIITMQPESWSVSTKGLINLYGAGFDFTSDDEGVVDGFNFTTPNMAGMGYALDLGLSWAPVKNIMVSAGIIDLGKVSWNKTFNRVARSEGEFVFTGIDNISLGESEEGDEDQFTEMQEAMLKMAQFRVVDESDNLVENLVPTINAGIEAGILNNKITVGVLYSNRRIAENSISEITGMVNLKPYSGFNVAASYSLLNGVENTFGLALGLNLGIANIFVACDYVPMIVSPQYIPLTQASTHVQVGLSVSLGKMKIRKK